MFNWFNLIVFDAMVNFSQINGYNGILLLYISLKQCLYHIIEVVCEAHWHSHQICIGKWSGTIKPDRGHNLAKVSTPWAQCYANGAWGVLSYTRLWPISGLILHDRDLCASKNI